MTELENNTKAEKKKHHCEICELKLSEDIYELDGMILCWDYNNEEEDLRGSTRKHSESC